MTQPAVVVSAIEKSFGEVHALKGVDLEIDDGIVFGLLGPNGAGKTTLVRILSTLLRPTAGRASVLGLDVVADAAKLRSRIGLAGQYAAVDPVLTGRENLDMVGQLYNLSTPEAKRRTAEVLERIGLTDAADRQAKTYSGGMRRRLDLAASLVGRPELLIMDEPTTGLDPQSRLDLWELIEELVSEGTTLLLTTQYLEEADRLANRIAVIDHGSVISEGTPDELKNQMGGDVLEFSVANPANCSKAMAAVAPFGEAEPSIDPDTDRIGVQIGSDPAVIFGAMRALEDTGVAVTGLELRRPTLDDVFLKLTGRAPADAEEEAVADGPTRRRTRRARR